MDTWGWKSQSAGAISLSNLQQTLWQNELGGNSLSRGADHSTLDGKADDGEEIFFHSHGVQGTKASNSDQVRHMIQHLPPSLDFTNVAPSSTEVRSTLIGMPYNMSPLISPKPHTLQVTNGMQGNSIGLSVGSLECLLSTTNSNTDTSVEDDGISMLFTDCENLWSFNSSGAISSGESDNNGLKEGGNGNGSDSYQRIHNHEETVSQCSSKPTCAKRSKEQEEIKAGVNYPCLDIFISDSSTTEGGFKLISEKPKKPRLDKHQSTSNINFQQANPWESSEPDTEAIAQMKEMIYRAAVFRPVNLGLEVVEKPKRKNVKISSDPQTVAARQRRERISERIRVLQRLVPGGNKMDTASMLDEAANYLKFLRSQVKALENLGHTLDHPATCTSSNPPFSSPFLFNQSFPMQHHQPFYPFPIP